MTHSTPDPSGLSRRQFLGTAAAAAGFFTVVPRHVLGGAGWQAPSETLRIAVIGCGGRGRNLVYNAGGYLTHEKVEVEPAGEDGKPARFETRRVKVAGEQIAALCDVDAVRAKDAFKRWSKAPKYRDFRVMLEREEKNIDAVIVATPDHVHAVAAMEAMRRGKHVYVEKPMTHDIHEARALTEAAVKYGLVTQMGNQGHSGEGIRSICEWIWAGAIGEVTEAHCWTNRPIWPQGMDRPKGKMEVPATLDWDLWLGPAMERPYHKDYLPFKWRGWWDFGTGVMGDMGCHIVDPVFEALKLGAPTHVSACSTPVNNESAPLASVIRYRFPAREGMAPVDLTWWDGGMMPPRPEELEPGRRMGDWDGGCLFVGTKGKLMCGCYGASPKLIPNSAHRAFKRPPKTLARTKRIYRDKHMDNWLGAIKAGTKACSDFRSAGPLTEMVLLANLAIRAKKPLEWDGAKMQVTNEKGANKWVRREYRKGWSL